MNGVNPLFTFGSGDDYECTVTQNGTLLTVVSGGCTFSHASVGTLITWPDGNTTLVLSSTLQVGSPSATVSVELDRPDPTIVKVFSGTLMANGFAVFQDKLALRGFTDGGGSSSVVIDMTRMKQMGAQGGGRSQSVWSFPTPANAVATPVNYLVGEDTGQTLKNKKFDRIAGDGNAVAVSVIKDTAAGIDLAPGVAGTNATVWLEPGSNAVAGCISVRVGSNPAARGAVVQVVLGGSQSIPAFVTLTPAITEAALITTTFATGATQRQFWLGVETKLTPGAKYQWYYHVFG